MNIAPNPAPTTASSAPQFHVNVPLMAGGMALGATGLAALVATATRDTLGFQRVADAPKDVIPMTIPLTQREANEFARMAAAEGTGRGAAAARALESESLLGRIGHLFDGPRMAVIGGVAMLGGGALIAAALAGN